jgi:hypothetical protein
LVAVALHEEREPGSAGGVAHPRKLLLARIGVAWIGQTSLAVLKASNLPLDVPGPVGHGADDNLPSWPSR